MGRMTAVQQTDPLSRSIELTEWDSVSPRENVNLSGISLGDEHSRRMAEALRGRIDIKEVREGIEISSTSYVGRVNLGPLKISIRPKLPALPLTRLLRYAYGLRDLSMVSDTETPIAEHGFIDLLIAMLASEVEELIHRGLARNYISMRGDLENPRGRILLAELGKQGGITEARLPCLYFERRTDWILNKVLLAGIVAAIRITEDRELKRRLHRLSDWFGDVSHTAPVSFRDIENAQRSLTRLTDTYAPAITLIRLIHEMKGAAFEDGNEIGDTPGFFFDMNIFFQRLLSRFLHDNLIAHKIEDEFSIRDIFRYSAGLNPKRRSAPKPRPDYGLFRGKNLVGFLDAKYRDVWDKGFSAEWLYQGSIYALASPSHKSVLLYATMSNDARDEQIDIQPPIAWSGGASGGVIFRPVPLLMLAELVGPNAKGEATIQRRLLAGELVMQECRNSKLKAHEYAGSTLQHPQSAA